MTAEIAILNKSAVALAADSAVTLSAGSADVKIFNTADKIFEMSDHNPIGIMIYNEMSFMEAPLSLLIKKFRKECSSHKRLEEAAYQFLSYLNTFGRECGQEIKERHIDNLIGHITDRVEQEISDAIRDLIFSRNVNHEDFKNASIQYTNNVITDLENAVSQSRPARFFEQKDFKIADKLSDRISEIVDKRFDNLSDDFKNRIKILIKNNLESDILSPGLTGIVVAGYGSDDMFPTLISYDIDGMICGALKYVRTNFVDIDRNVDPEKFKNKAKILPFAQREMVDRFLYGLDDNGQDEIAKFARKTISIIRENLAKKYTFENDEDAKIFADDMQNLEDVFINNLTAGAFTSIRNASRRDIEDMVEFMPKPDLAHMAEALVELTSVKRKVSRGMETVGGPIDVAIISQSEGFVWIKRKHYFPQDLNSRYYLRIGRTIRDQRENEDGSRS